MLEAAAAAYLSHLQMQMNSTSKLNINSIFPLKGDINSCHVSLGAPFIRPCATSKQRASLITINSCHYKTKIYSMSASLYL